jgi:hypothetical protein
MSEAETKLVSTEVQKGLVLQEARGSASPAALVHLGVVVVESTPSTNVQPTQPLRTIETAN